MIETVFILTKESKRYTQEGKLNVLSGVKETFPVAEDVTIIEGEMINRPKYLGEEARKLIGGDTFESCRCCFVISKPGHISILGGTKHNIEGFIKDTETHPDLNSWEIFMGELATLEE